MCDAMNDRFGRKGEFLTTTSTKQKPPFEGVSATPQPLSVKDDRSIATMAHFGGVVGCVACARVYSRSCSSDGWACRDGVAVRADLDAVEVEDDALERRLCGVVGWLGTHDIPSEAGKEAAVGDANEGDDNHDHEWSRGPA